MRTDGRDTHIGKAGTGWGGGAEDVSRAGLGDLFLGKGLGKESVVTYQQKGHCWSGRSGEDGARHPGTWGPSC